MLQLLWLFQTTLVPPQAPEGDVKSGILELFIIKYRYNYLNFISSSGLFNVINFIFPLDNELNANYI